MFRQESWERDYQNEATPWRDKNPERISDWLKRVKLSSGRALVLGCGTGEHAIWLAEHNFTVEAVDYSEEALKIAKKSSDRVTWVNWDLENLAHYPFRHDKYDLILDIKVVAFIRKRGLYFEAIRDHLENTYIIEAFLRHNELAGISVEKLSFERDLAKYFRLMDSTLVSLPHKEVIVYYCSRK